MTFFSKTVPATLFSGAMLCACGGGSSGSAPTPTPAPTPAPTPTPTPTPTPAPTPTIADCFKLTPGVEYTLSNDRRYRIVQEEFEGVSAFGRAELRQDDTRFGVFYSTVGETYIQFLGIAQYDQSGTEDGKNVYTGDQIPVNMMPGQTADFTYTDRRIRYSPASDTSTTSNVSIKFVGFEDVTLADHLFSNTCKIESTEDNSTTVDVAWVAQGFGTIQHESRDAQDVLVPDSHVELETIIAAP